MLEIINFSLKNKKANSFFLSYSLLYNIRPLIIGLFDGNCRKVNERNDRQEMIYGKKAEKKKDKEILGLYIYIRQWIDRYFEMNIRARNLIISFGSY